MSSREKLLKIGLPFLILTIVALITVIMVKSRKSPEKIEQIERGALVEYLIAERSSRQVTINSTGTVQPRQEVTITPQVNGNVTSISPRFYPGGFFKEGDTLFEIETVDYELALQQAQAAMAKREFELSSVQSRARIARREWERMKKGQENMWRSRQIPCFSTLTNQLQSPALSRLVAAQCYGSWRGGGRENIV